MKLKFWGEKESPEVDQKTEADAMKGKYRLQSLDWRMRQHLANEVVADQPTPKDGEPSKENEEHWVDRLQRQTSIATTGQGALGKDYPITPKNRLARERLLAIARYASSELGEKNRLRTFMTRHALDSTHTVFDRSVEFDEPEVVLTYKPMLFPGNEAPPQKSATDEGEQDKKKP